MTLRRLFRFWLLVLIVLSVAAVSIATIRLWILMFVGPVLVASWYVTESHRGFQLPRFMVNLGALSALAFVIALAVRSMTTSCIHYMLGENDRKECIMGVLEAFMSLAIVLLIAIVLLNIYLWGRRTIMMTSRLSDML